jgi:Spermine/spermidine synthase.
LIIGLGGGSLTKHLLHHFPDCRLKVVEYRESVVKIARSHFGLPLDPRLKVIIDDGAKYVRQRTESQSEQYSLMFVDAFDHEGMAPSISNHAFFDACKMLLKKDGMLVINLWGGAGNPYSSRLPCGWGVLLTGESCFFPFRTAAILSAWPLMKKPRSIP